MFPCHASRTTAPHPFDGITPARTRAPTAMTSTCEASARFGGPRAARAPAAACPPRATTPRCTRHCAASYPRSWRSASRCAAAPPRHDPPRVPTVARPASHALRARIAAAWPPPPHGRRRPSSLPAMAGCRSVTFHRVPSPRPLVHAPPSRAQRPSRTAHAPTPHARVSRCAGVPCGLSLAGRPAGRVAQRVAQAGLRLHEDRRARRGALRGDLDRAAAAGCADSPRDHGPLWRPGDATHLRRQGSGAPEHTHAPRRPTPFPPQWAPSLTALNLGPLWGLSACDSTPRPHPLSRAAPALLLRCSRRAPSARTRTMRIRCVLARRRSAS